MSKKIRRSRTEYSFYNIIAGFVGYFINTTIGYICRMVFVRCLSEEYLGINGLLSNYLSMLSIAELGIGSAIVYELYKPIANNDHKKIASLMRVYAKAYHMIGIIVAVVGVATMPLITFVVGDTKQINENIYVIYALFLFNTVSGYFFSYRGALISAQQRNYIVLSVSYIVSILQSLVQIILLITVKSYLPYLFVLVIGGLCYNIIITVWAKKDYPYMDDKNAPRLSDKEKRSILKNVKALTSYKISGVLVNHTDNLVITYFSGLGITGLASNYTLLVNTLNTLVQQMFNAITASVGNLNAGEDMDHQYEFFEALNLSNFWIYGWAAVGIAFVTEDLVELCFGKNYVLSVSIPIMLAINVYMVGMQNAVWTFKNTKGMFKYGQYILFVTAAINIIGDIVLGKMFGLIGIYAATAISRLVTNTWYEPYALFRYGFNKSPLIYLKRYVKYVIILLITFGLCGIVCYNIKGNIFFRILIKMVICLVVPNIVFLLVFHRKQEFLYIKEIIKRVINLIYGAVKKIKN